jgi:hypothetical protein
MSLPENIQEILYRIKNIGDNKKDEEE